MRVIDAFAEDLDMSGLGFGRSKPGKTSRQTYNPHGLLKLYLYGCFH